MNGVNTQRFLLRQGMMLNMYGTLYKVKRVRSNGKVTLQYKGFTPLPEKKEENNETIKKD